MEPSHDAPRGGTALIVVPGVGDDSPGDTVGAATRAVLRSLGPSAHARRATRSIVVPALPGSGAAPAVHEVQCAEIHSPRRTRPLVAYEMHWADLSRFPNTLLRFVMTLYGVLFQITTIGIEAFRAMPGLRWAPGVIRVFSYLAGVVVVGLTAGAALLGVEMAALARVDSREGRLVVASATLLVAIVLVWLGDRFLRSNGWRFGEGREGPERHLMRPGAFFGLVALGAGVMPLVQHARGRPLDVAVHEVLWFGVRWVHSIGWAMVGGVAIAIALTALAVIPSRPDDPEQRSRNRATRTAVLSVVVSGLGIALLGALLVAAGLTLTVGIAGATTPIDPDVARDVGADANVGAYGAAVFERSLRPLGVALICALALVALVAVAGSGYASALAQARWKERPPLGSGWTAAVIVAVAALLVVTLAREPSPAGNVVAIALAIAAACLVGAHWARRFRPGDGRAPLRRGFARILAYLGGLGHVLALSFALIVAATALLMSTPLTPEAGGSLSRLSERLFSPLTNLVEGPSLGTGVRVSAVVAVLLGLAALGRTRLAAFARGLDLAYDVATYMRVPHGAPGGAQPVEPPRRKVLRRYAALLDHIQATQRPERVVIVAHSQGSVYTLALLLGDVFRDAADQRDGGKWPIAPRLLPARPLADGSEARREPAPALRAPLTLVTMGCPLRQTYAPNFPGQYDWPSDPAAVATLLEQIGPGTTWLNMYHSGDYLGRALWGERICDPLPTPRSIADICIGPGQHTGYWGDPAFTSRVRRLL